MATITKPNLTGPITQTDWANIENYYITELNQIHIPEDPKPFDITSINSKLERLFHEVRLDYYYANKSNDKIADAYRKLKRALYPITKTGKNQEERDSMLQDHLMQTTLDLLPPKVITALGIPAIPKTVYDVQEAYQDRVDFLKAILDIISDKTGRLITDSGAMKIESNFGK